MKRPTTGISASKKPKASPTRNRVRASTPERPIPMAPAKLVRPTDTAMTSSPPSSRMLGRLVEQVSGRRLLAVVIGWAAAAALVYGVIVLLARVVAPHFVRAHIGDFSASFVLAAYLLLFGALWFGFGGLRGLAGRLGFRYTSAAHLLLAPVAWLVTVLVG